MHIENAVLLASSFLFCTGMYLLLNRKDLIHLLIGLEIMLNSANLNLIFFSTQYGGEGIVFSVFILLIAVCEASVGLAIFLRAYRNYQSSETGKLTNLREL